MSASKDSGAGPGPEKERRKKPTTVVTGPRRGVIVALRDAELGERVSDLVSRAGLEAAFSETVAGALGAWSDEVGAVLVDASFSREAVPLVRRASETAAVVLVAGGPSDGEGTLRLLEAGARGYVPLPQPPEKIAFRLHETLTRENELRGERSLIELAKSELQAAFDTFPSALVVIGPDLQVRRANRAALLLSRRESFKDILGRASSDVFGWSGEEDGPIAQAITGGEEVECEFEVSFESPSGTARCLHRCRVFARGDDGQRSEARGPPGLGDGALALIEDVTSANREDLERARREKLEAVALLAATLSHEINQPLGTILGRAQLALLGLDQPDAKGIDLRRDLKDIVKSVERISGILDRLHQVTDIVTKTYPGGARILDLERSSRLPPSFVEATEGRAGRGKSRPGGRVDSKDRTTRSEGNEST